MKNESKNLVVDLLKSKSILKQEVYANTKKWFKLFKDELSLIHI